MRPSSLDVTKNSDQQSIISKSLYHTQSRTHISRTKKNKKGLVGGSLLVGGLGPGPRPPPLESSPDFNVRSTQQHPEVLPSATKLDVDSSNRFSFTARTHKTHKVIDATGRSTHHHHHHHHVRLLRVVIRNRTLLQASAPRGILLLQLSLQL